MFSTLRNRFGIPGVISVMALVFAMFGGAYAASNSSAVARPPRAPRPRRGRAARPERPVPPDQRVPRDAAGPKGDAGAPGANGAPGAPGESVKLSAPGAACPEGGTKVSAGASSANVCNGEAGEQGEEGSPWTAGGVLPPEATETGAYVITSEIGNRRPSGIRRGEHLVPDPAAGGAGLRPHHPGSRRRPERRIPTATTPNMPARP